MSDPMLLELFKTELETQTALLSSGLLALEENPAHAGTQAELMRAAHSLKGAARIADLPAIVAVAHALEDCFVAVQEGRMPVGQPLIDLALEVNDWFGEAARLEPGALESSLAEQRAKAENLEQRLQTLLSVPSGASSGRDSPPLEIPSPSDATVWEIDDSLLDLLKSELESQVDQLNRHLLALEENGPIPEILNALMRAAHSVKGAGRIVGFDPMVKAAHRIEDYFDHAAREKPDQLQQTEIERTFAFCDLLQKAARTDLNGFKAMLLGTAAEFERLAGARFETGGPTASPKPGGAREPEVSKPAEPAARPKRQEEERALKVSAERMNRIMGLASEILVERNQFEPVVKSFLRIKSAKLDLASTLSQLQLVMGKDPQTRGLLMMAREQLDQSRRMINEQFDQLEAMNAQGMKLANQLYQETLSSRMRPFQEGVQGFPRLVRDIARELNKRVKYTLLGPQTRVDRDVLAKLEAPLNHIIRNALDHGMESPTEREAAGKSPEGRLTVEARHRAGMLLVTVQDDGRGIDSAKVRARVIERGLATAEMLEKMSESEILEFLFLPGFSTARQVTEISGRGVGLDVVQTMVQEEGGAVRVTSKTGAGTIFHLNLPVTRSVMRAMITEICGDPYGFPLARIERVLVLSSDAIRQVEGRTFFECEGANIGLVSAGEILGLPASQRERENVSLLMLEENNQRYAVEVDTILGERDCVVRPIDARLGKIPDVSAVSIMEDGSPMWLVDVDDMVRSIDTMLNEGRLGRGRRALGKGGEAGKKRQVLVVDDSLTVREIERKLLERHGYEVDVAVDGMEGWHAARLGQYDLIVSDVDMPRMNGIEFIQRLRQDTRLVSVPVIIVSYKDREEDRLRGMEAGASQYLTKSSFQDDTFIQTVEDLIGR